LVPKLEGEEILSSSITRSPLPKEKSSIVDDLSCYLLRYEACLKVLWFVREQINTSPSLEDVFDRNRPDIKTANTFPLTKLITSNKFSISLISLKSCSLSRGLGL
jgi:hypothetical protein